MGASLVAPAACPILIAQSIDSRTSIVTSGVPAPSQIGGLFPMTRTKTPGLPTYCGRQSPGSVPHLLEATIQGDE